MCTVSLSGSGDLNVLERVLYYSVYSQHTRIDIRRIANTVLILSVVLVSRVTWLILPVVICLSQRLSHACLSISTSTVKLRMAH